MKQLVFINGYAGVGKTTVSELLHTKLNNSAWLQSEWCRAINPFVFNDEIEAITEKNITSILRTYLESSFLEYIIFTWGIHGRRQIILNKVLQNLQDLNFEYIPITLLCDREEHIRRMVEDRRTEDRILRSLETRSIYELFNYPRIDTSRLTPEQTVDMIIDKINE